MGVGARGARRRPGLFPELALQSLGKNRIIADPLEVVARAPDIILGSWCGKKFQPDEVAARPGWSQVPAVRDGFLREIKSALILQPGPAALTDGVRAVQAVIEEWAAREPATPDAAPGTPVAGTPAATTDPAARR